MDMNTTTLPKKGLKKYDYYIDMEKKDLKKLTKDQLIKLLLNKVVIVDDTKPTRPKRRKKVSNHEDLLDNDPFKDEVTQHIKPPPPILQLEDKDVSSPKITRIQKALKNSTKSFAVDIVDNKDLLHQLTETKKVIEHYLNKELGELKGFKYIETLKMTF